MILETWFKFRIRTKMLATLLIMTLIPLLGLSALFFADILKIRDYSTEAGKYSEPVDATEVVIDKEVKNTLHTFIIIFIVLILVVSVISLLISRRITNPIVTLARGAEAIGKGELEHRVEVETGDELEELANSFNEMAADLKGYMDELQRTTAERERLLKELEIAKGIQQSFLPEDVPEIEGIELAASNISAWEVGGDFYDFIPIAKEKWGLVIADVSGKGIPAALFMALSRTLIRASTIGNPTVANAIEKANELIFADSKSSMFVTLFYAIVDSQKMKLKYINAGHNPPLLFRASTGDVHLLKAEGIVLGVLEDIRLKEAEIELTRGDVVVLFTDGITDANNEKKEEFGEERLIKVIRENSTLSAQDLMVKIQGEVMAFAGEQPQFDDITLMILKVT